MNDEDRGKIHNREYAQKLKDFSGLRFGKITPTDLDGFTDFGNKKFVFIECKYGIPNLQYGQKLAIERLCDCCQKGGIDTIYIVTSHKSVNDINVAILPVFQYRFKKIWWTPNPSVTVRKAFELFLEWKPENKCIPIPILLKSEVAI